MVAFGADPAKRTETSGCAAGITSATRSAAAPFDAISTRAVRPPSGAAIQVSSDNGTARAASGSSRPKPMASGWPLPSRPGALAALYDFIGAASAALGAASSMRCAGAPAEIESDVFFTAMSPRYSAGGTERISKSAAADTDESPTEKAAKTAAAVVVIRRQNIGCSRFTRRPVNQGIRATLEWRAGTRFISRDSRTPPPDTRQAQHATVAIRSRTRHGNALLPTRRTPVGARASGTRRS